MSVFIVDLLNQSASSAVNLFQFFETLRYEGFASVYEGFLGEVEWCTLEWGLECAGHGCEDDVPEENPIEDTNSGPLRVNTGNALALAK